MDECTARIIRVAMELAEEDGYDAVRLRDVARLAEVALGTVYKRFSSKEDILAAVLNLQVSMLRDAVRASPPKGKTTEARLNRFFEQVTSLFAERPKMATAMLRTVASGVPELVERVTRYHSDMTEMILLVMRGGETATGEFSEEQEELLAHLFQDVWFAALVGWTGGVHDHEFVIGHLRSATHLLLRGARTE